MAGFGAPRDTRRLRLRVYQLLNFLPPAVYRKGLPLWLQLRRGLMRKLKRAS
jgi:hypothetical protein